MNRFRKLGILSLVALCLTLSGCEEPRVYGSVGFSSYSGNYHRGGMGGSISVGGRIY